MKRAAIVLLSVVLLAGCASAPPKPAVTVTVTPSPSATSASDSIPACTTFIGQPTDAVFVVGKGPQCTTGSDLASDSTGYAVTNCDPVGNESTPVYSWVSSDVTAPDGNEYAAKQGGVVVVVPNGSPSSPSIIASILSAVGCP
jgi:hypothetical protein